MFKKGKSGNPKGRPRGTKNGARKDLISRIAAIMDNNIDTLQKDLDSLEPADRIKAITGLIGYVIPKKQAVSMEQSIDYEYHKLEVLLQNAPDEAINKIIERVEFLRDEYEKRGGFGGDGNNIEVDFQTVDEYLNEQKGGDEDEQS